MPETHRPGGEVPQTERIAVAFARVLRGAGLDVPVGRAGTFAEALTLTGVDRSGAVYWAGRTTLLARPEDIPTYNRAFDAFWRGRATVPFDTASPVELTIVLDTEEEAPPGEGEEPTEPDGPTLVMRWSRQEVLRHKDFAAYSADEFEEARRLMADLRLHGALRRSRRRRPSRKAEGRPDLRRTVRRSLRSGGEPIRRAFSEPGERPRRIVLICDVSGSMEPYSRALVRFLHAAVVGRGRIEAFALGTRLTRITRELSSRDPDAALAKASRSVPDWSGGTRLGEGLRAFNDQWGVRGMARGSVVVILSDGWDRGDPGVLAEQMQRLQRVAYRTVWVNPLKASPGYAPLAAGMAAALPFVDEFVEGHSLDSLQKLAEVISR
ncbi:MAG TPA: VWA domain-containing protein [Acidimicrobiia bacterium]|nr:VWA domain-containing protein [Acidimicrobiia bacterium]